MTQDGYFLSKTNPIANTDQREMEDRAMRLLARPEIEKAHAMTDFLFRQVYQHTAGEQMKRFDEAVGEYVFHYAMRAVGRDGQYPGVARFMTPGHHWFGRDVPGSRWGMDSPDFCYRILSVDHGSNYVIRGKSTCDEPITSFYSLMGENNAAPTILSLLDGLDVPKAANGEFEITVGPDDSDGRANHIQTQPGTMQIWNRDAISDWNAQTPNALQIEKLDPVTRDPLSDDELVAWLAPAITDGVYYEYYMAATLMVRPPNEIKPPASSGPFGGMASQYTTAANIVLEDDEALIITTNGAGALFRNSVLGDVLFNSLNYWDNTSCLNSAQMAADETGLFTSVVAHHDPGVHNWLDTTGVRQMIWGQRWQSFPGGVAKEQPTIEAKLVKLDDLEKNMPQGALRIDATGRAEQVAARQAGVASRYVDS
ncbi:MAG: hypothetical protein P8J20_07905 [Novosphingobium sp.]|nr:hypothetical protein [Novosphingobium sp.]